MNYIIVGIRIRKSNFTEFNSDGFLIDRLSDLRLLSALRGADTLSAAARSLGTTQSAVTKALQRIEARLGAPVVDRGRAGLKWTLEGDRFWTDLEPLQLAVAGLRMAREGTTLRGRARLAVPDITSN